MKAATYPLSQLSANTPGYLLGSLLGELIPSKPSAKTPNEWALIFKTHTDHQAATTRRANYGSSLPQTGSLDL